MGWHLFGQTPPPAPTAEALFHAIATGQTNAALRMLEADPSLAHERYNLSKLPLLEATAAGNLPVLKRLVALGADLNARGDFLMSAGSQATALHVAVRCHQSAVCRWLLEAGADPNLRAFGTETPLHVAFTENRGEMAAWLLEFGADPFLPKRFANNHSTPFELAITRGSGRLVPYMLAFRPLPRGETRHPLENLKAGEAPPDPRAQQLLATNGPTWLVGAARRGELEAVEALLQAGVQPSDRVADDYTPLQAVALAVAAAERGKDFLPPRWAKIRKQLENAGAKCDALAATGFGDWEMTRRILTADPHAINERDFTGATPLHWAVKTDRLSFTSFWLDAGASPDAADLTGQTPLHLAAAQGLVAPVQRLRAAQASTSARDQNGQTPLDVAAQAGQTETIRLLLAHAQEPPLNRAASETIHEAVASGNIVALAAFATPKNLEARNELGLTPLLLAARQGQLGAAAFLLDRGANVKACDPEGNSVLHLVLLNRTQRIAGRPSDAWITRQQQDPQKEKLLRLLTATNEFGVVNDGAATVAFFLAYGADANIKNRAGETALQLVTEGKMMTFGEDRAALLPLLLRSSGGLDLRDGKGETALHRAARGISGEDAATLIAAGADLNATNQQGRTPLHVTVEKLGGWGDSLPFARILEAKPDVNAQDRKGLAPLHLLMLSDSIFIHKATEALLAAGADPNLRDRQGRTPLLCALAGKWPWAAAQASLGQLVAGGARTGVTDNEGDNALHYLARMGAQNPVFFLGKAIKRLAAEDVNARNHAGDTPLHVAARSGSKHVFDWLRGLGARLDVTNAAGQTPAQLLENKDNNPFARWRLGLPDELTGAAQRGEHETLERALKVNPALLNATNAAGETLLRIAVRSRQTNTVAALLQKGAQWDAVSATLLGRVESLKELLAQQPAAITNSSQGKQLIHLAAETGDVAILELLFANGADVNAPARSGLSPLGIALMNQQNLVADRLRKQSASENLFDAVVLDLPDRVTALLAQNPNLSRATNRFGFTAAHLAVALERTGALAALLMHEVPPDIPADRIRVSPLHVAAACNRTNALALLLQHGARVEVADEWGCTPLHYAAARGATESVALLLGRGAQPGLPVSGPNLRVPIRRPAAGNTALHFAVSARHTNIVALLLAAGANVNATNSLGWTALDLLRPGASVLPQMNRPFSSPGFQMLASFQSMGLPQLAGLVSLRPVDLDSPTSRALAAVLQRAGAKHGDASRLFPSRQ